MENPILWGPNMNIETTFANSLDEQIYEFNDGQRQVKY